MKILNEIWSIIKITVTFFVIFILIILFVAFMTKTNNFEIKDGKGCNTTKPALSIVYTEKCYKLEEVK